MPTVFSERNENVSIDDSTLVVQGHVSSPNVQPRGGYFTLKVVLDFVLAATLLLLCSPLILICALLVRLTSRGPAFYSQLRLGLAGKPYWIYKLRTMYHRCEDKSGPQWSQSGDTRITPLGRFLRRTHLDELPQLWNILKGEMSLIGPRPERPEFLPQLRNAIPLYESRLAVRPGVTGLAQVQLPADSHLGGVRVKVAYDLYYVRHAGLGMDLRIYAATVLKIFGLGFDRLGRLFKFPKAQVVEQHYQQLQEQVATPTELQPEFAPTA
jgi:lipopolysaccharide/colanic/teichoic acid biosynthesis glycosyltransferase